jgi:hypothetical protein
MEDHTYRTLADNLDAKPFKSVAVLFGTQQRALIVSDDDYYYPHRD